MFWPPLETVVTQPKQGKWNLDISWLRTCVPFAVHRTVRFYHNAVRAFRTGELETLYHFLKLSFSQNEFSVFKTGRFIILSNYRFVATRLYSVLEARTRGGVGPSSNFATTRVLVRKPEFAVLSNGRRLHWYSRCSGKMSFAKVIIR